MTSGSVPLVLVFPYRRLPAPAAESSTPCSGGSADLGFWQGVSGGGGDGETPFEAAKREAFEEGGIPPESRYMALDATATIPVVEVARRFHVSRATVAKWVRHCRSEGPMAVRDHCRYAYADPCTRSTTPIGLPIRMRSQQQVTAGYRRNRGT